MPVRQMEYDVMEYRRQIKEIAAKNRRMAKEQEMGENEQNCKAMEGNVKERSGFWRNNGEFLHAQILEQFAEGLAGAFFDEAGQVCCAVAQILG